MKKLFITISLLVLLSTYAFGQVKIYVAVNGNDKNSGAIESPFKSLHRAQKEAYKIWKEKKWLMIKQFNH